MAVFTIEVEESSSLPASKLFNVFNDFDNVAPKVEPETYKSISVIEGDGGVGSIKNITFGDGIPYTYAKHKVNTIDANNLCLSYTIFEGDALLDIIESGTHNVKVTPSANGGSVYKHTAELKCKGDAKLNDDYINLTKEAFKKTFKAFEGYAKAHPEAY